MTLTQYLAQQPAAFDWRTRNCCHFAAGWVEARTGKHPMASLPLTPDVLAARRLLKKLGGLLGAWTEQLGKPMLPSFAQVGDVVLVPADLEGHEAVGICVGSTVAVVLQDGSVGMTPLTAATACWRVG